MQKQSFLMIALVGLSLTFFSADCGGREDDLLDEFGEVELNFQGFFGSEPLVMLANEYDYEAGMDVRFQLFQFYVAEIKLITKDGEKVNLGDIELINFENIQSAEAASKGLSFSFNNIPAGEYRAIEMGIGVSGDLNEQAPSDYPVGHPLAVQGNYWSGLSSYIFTKIEGNADLNGDGEFTEKLTFHIGEKEDVPLYQTISLDYDLTVSKDQSSVLPLSVDLKQVISPSSTSFLDFREVSQDHTNQAAVYTLIIDNLQKNAIRVRQ
ncbi:MAG: hypothetical protein KTR30_33360 [Saprospiraceae bacterium]|nr:hypothetical protein [Saprospiraceae bacterium]